jgi:Cys-tRNA(Pro)/Cys-tRNA(Cys) deacylase
VTGGISPFGQKKTLPVFLAAQALEYEQVYVSGGKRGLEIAVAPQDLIRCCHASVCKLCRDA